MVIDTKCSQNGDETELAYGTYFVIALVHSSVQAKFEPPTTLCHMFNKRLSVMVPIMTSVPILCNHQDEKRAIAPRYSIRHCF